MRVEGLIGKNTVDVASYICQRNPDIQRVTVSTYLHTPGSDSSDTRSVNLDDPQEISRTEALSGEWVSRMERERHGLITCVVLCSRVVVAGGRVRHIPMLDVDYTYEFGTRGVKEIRMDIRDMRRELFALGLPSGVILNSGCGLHYLSSHLVEDYDLPFLFDVMETKGDDVDLQWLEFARESGFFALRANRGSYKLQVPEVVALYRPRHKIKSIEPPDFNSGFGRHYNYWD